MVWLDVHMFYHNGYIRVGATGHSGPFGGGGDWKTKWGYGFEPTLNYNDGHGQTIKPRTAFEQWEALGISDHVANALVDNEFGLTWFAEIDARELPDMLRSLGRYDWDRVLYLKQQYERGLLNLDEYNVGDEIAAFENQCFSLGGQTLGYDADRVAIGT